MFGCSSCFSSWTTAPIAASLVGANFSKIGRRRRGGSPFARTRECVDGGKEIEGNILEGRGIGENGVLLVNL